MGHILALYGDKLKVLWPQLAEHYERVLAAPGIAEYMASPQRLPNAMPA